MRSEKFSIENFLIQKKIRPTTIFDEKNLDWKKSRSRKKIENIEKTKKLEISRKNRKFRKYRKFREKKNENLEKSKISRKNRENVKNRKFHTQKTLPEGQPPHLWKKRLKSPSALRGRF